MHINTIKLSGTIFKYGFGFDGDFFKIVNCRELYYKNAFKVIFYNHRFSLVMESSNLESSIFKFKFLPMYWQSSS